MDVVTIFNQAISAIGHRARIATENEASREAEICRLWYPTVRNQVMSAAPWTSLKKVAKLVLSSEREDDGEWELGMPQPGYLFSFILPTDLLIPRYLTSYASFEITNLNSARALQTNDETPILIYTGVVEDPNQWGLGGLTMAVTYALASYICHPITGKRALAADTADKANRLILEARAQEANFQYVPQDTVPDWILARGAGGASPQRFIYPANVSLIPVGGANVS